jgi:lysophospholipase L1-like esterase
VTVRRALALLLFGLGMGVLLLEVGFRVLGITYPRITQHDENRGKAYRPNVAWHQRDEGNAEVRMNSAGFRDVERRLAKPPGTVRLAVLGDSFVDALQVPLDSAFTQVVERRLASCRAFGEARVEVLNFGVSGYGTAQQLQTYRHVVRQYDPDVVLLAFLAANDVRDNGAALFKDPQRPYFTLAGDSLVLDTTFRRRASRWPSWVRGAAFALLDRSRVAQVVYRARMRAREAARLELIHGRQDVLGDAPHQELGLDNMVYRPAEHPAWREAWRVTEALLDRLRHETSADGADFMIVTIPSSIQVHPDEAVRTAFLETLGVDSLTAPELRVSAWGAAHAVPVVRLAPRLAAYAAERHAWLHGFSNTRPGYGHWNSLGHALAGQLIAEAVAERCGVAACPAVGTP